MPASPGQCLLCVLVLDPQDRPGNEAPRVLLAPFKVEETEAQGEYKAPCLSRKGRALLMLMCQLDFTTQTVATLPQSPRGSHRALLCPKVDFSDVIENRQRFPAGSSCRDGDAEGLVLELWGSEQRPLSVQRKERGRRGERPASAHQLPDP